MPKGPNGEWRPVGDIECAALVCRIATGESPEVYGPPDTSASTSASRAGKARAATLSPERRAEIARAGGRARAARRAER